MSEHVVQEVLESMFSGREPSIDEVVRVFTSPSIQKYGPCIGVRFHGFPILSVPPKIKIEKAAKKEKHKTFRRALSADIVGFLGDNPGESFSAVELSVALDAPKTSIHNAVKKLQQSGTLKKRGTRGLYRYLLSV